MKTRKVLATIALLLGTLASGSSNSAILFDFDGAGGAFAPQQVQSFDWAPTSFLALNGQAAIANFIGTGGACPANSCNFEVLTHATMIGALAPGNSTIPLPGIGSTFEITLVARFTETVTFANPALGLALFATVPGSGWVEMYFHGSPDAAALTGSGFDNGRLILNGNGVSSATGIFLVTSQTPTPLDGTGVDNYPGQSTVPGTGSNGNLSFGGMTVDPTFFTSGIDAMGLTFANISVGLPFVSVDPSDCFNTTVRGAGSVGSSFAASTCDTLHVAGPMSAQTGGAGMVVPVIGPTNGLFFGDNPDFVAQSDFNSPLQGRIPEPGVLVLLSLGLGVIGALTTRRRRTPLQLN